MGGSAAGGLRSQQQWTPSWILPEIEIRLKLHEMVVSCA